MANEVYIRTQQGLAELVSAGAASRMLESALADAGLDTDLIDAERMRLLLLGPIQAELMRILPRRGLPMRLAEIASALPTSPHRSTSAPLTARPAEAPASIARERAVRVVTGVRTQLAAQREHTQKELERAVLKLATIESVTLVAAVRNSGQTAFSRGSGDIDELSRIGMVALSLLKKSGPLRLFYVAHEQASLLVFPWGPDALLLAGSPELNVGSALTVFADLQIDKEAT